MSKIYPYFSISDTTRYHYSFSPVDMPLCFRTKSGVCPSRALITNIVNDVTCPACAFMTKPRQYRWLHRIFLARINRLAIEQEQQ